MNNGELKTGVVIDDLPVGKITCGFKMSDVFRLPVSTDFEVCQIVNHDKNAFGAELKYKHHVFSAINNHDRLEQENAELRGGALEVSFKANDAFLSKGEMMDYDDFERIKQLLNK